MIDRPVVRRVLWAVTPVCLVAALVAIPVVSDDEERLDASDDPARVTADEEPAPGVASTQPDGVTEPGPAASAGGGGDGGDVGGSAAVPAPPAADGREEPSAGSTSNATPGSTTTPAQPREGLGAPVDPGPPVAPKPGLYRYRVTGGAEGDGESTTRVEEQGRSGDEVRLLVAIASGGVTITSDVVWRPDGVRTLRSRFTFGSSTGECDWEPDVVEAVFPLQPGATWRSDSSCQMTGLTPAPIELQRTSSAKVLELRRTEVAGQTVDVWAVERVERLSGGGRSEEVTVVALFSPKHGLDVDVRGTRSGQEYRRELLGLEPAPA